LGKITHVLSTNLYIFGPLSLHNKCVCENEDIVYIIFVTIDYHHSSVLQVRNTCRCSLTQRLVRWCIPVVPKILIETQTRVAKGQQMGRAEAIQTSCVFPTLPPLLCVCLQRTYFRKEQIADIKNDLATYCYKSSIQSAFFHTLFEA